MKKNGISRWFSTALLLAAGMASVQLKGQAVKSSLELEEALERGIYLQEGKADLGGAAEVYESILDEAKLIDSLSAETRYRLALVYIEQGKRVQGIGLLKEVVDNYPSETRWVDEAKLLLPKEFVPERVPWTNGERTYYDWGLPSGDVMGKSFGTIYEYEWEGRSLWRKETRYMLNGDRATAVEFDKETFQTVYSNILFGQVGNVRTWYGEDAKSAKVVYAKSGEEREFDFQMPVYDNEHTYELMRQMPAEVGFKTELTLFVSFAGAPVGVTFEVVGIEEMDTAVGRVECYQIEIDLVAQKQFVHITNDDRRLIVKFVVGGIEGVLTKVETIDYSGKSSYVDPEFGYEIEYPGSWGTIKPPRSKRRVHITEPMARGEFLINATPVEDWKGEDSLSLESMREFIKKEILEDFAGFEVEEDWTTDVALDLPKADVIKLTKTEDRKETVAYLHYGIGESAFYVMMGRIHEDDEKELLPIYREMVTSFRSGD